MHGTEPQGRPAEQEAEDETRYRAEGQRQIGGHAPLGRQHCHRVGTDGEERAMADGELPADPGKKVQPQNGDGEDDRIREAIEVIVLQHERKREGDQKPQSRLNTNHQRRAVVGSGVSMFDTSIRFPSGSPR